uniref:Venom protein family 4 protein 1 n=1 Tax=Pristhesancus plagipennis TaxID=1955184 RepID=A0A1Q1NPD0_PRIPG|nr:venom protein family 4 protein 1 [Pristhesancus plagipennis]
MYLLQIAVVLALAVSAFAEMKDCRVEKSKIDFEVHRRICCAKVVGYSVCVQAETDLSAWTHGKPAFDSGIITLSIAGEPIKKIPFSSDPGKNYINTSETCVNNSYLGKICLKMRRVEPKDWRKGGIGICYTLKLPVHQYADSKCIYLKGKEFIDLSIKQHLQDN